MWKEETPVSRLIDELVGKKSLVMIIYLCKDRGRFMSSFIFTTNGGGCY